MNNRFHLLLFLSFLFAISLTHANAQVNLPACGETLEITSLTSDDLLITSELSSITIELRGGDGGDVKLDGSICGNKTIEGGSGATVKATFSVGTGAGELEPGGKLRVFAGRAGERIRKICSNGGNHNSGGGGSSAVLYLPPGGSRWHLLAVAGGGGGANRQSAGITNEGRGANSDENGDSVGSANGGSQDGCAQSGIVTPQRRGFSGGDYNCFIQGYPQRGRSMATGLGLFNPIRIRLRDNSEAALTGGREGEDTDGGNGFTGGGAGHGGGGGGGGFYGGAATSIRAGGGGGSYISSWHNPSNTSKTAGSRGGGNESDGWVKIVAADNVAPNVSCGTTIKALDENGQNTLDLFSLFNSSDNCSIASETVLKDGSAISTSLVDFDCSDLGNNIFEVIVIDGNNNPASCISVVVVVDNRPPTANCKDITATLDENGQAIVDAAQADAGSADNCDIPDFFFMDGNETVNSLTLDCSSAGVNARTVLVKDQKNNTAECSVNITVVNSTAPIITCPADITVDNDPGMCSAVVAYSAPAGADNCSGLIAELTNGLGAGAAFPVGTTEETYQVTDGAGNSASCSFTITVNNTENPTLSCPADITVDNDPGLCSAAVFYPITVGADHCSGSIIEQTAGLGSGSSFPVGTTTETYMATDGAGNSASCSFTITVNDKEAPNLSCPAYIIVDNDPNQCSAVVEYTFPLASDNCTGGVNIVQLRGLGSGSAFPVGTTAERYGATDASGNTAYCSFKITVNDVEAPQISCPPTIEVPATSSEGAVVTYTDPLTTDNCNRVSVKMEEVADLSNGDTFPIGTTVNTFTAIDASGNSQSCSFDVIVTGIAPDIACPADITVNNDPGHCGAFVDFVASETTGIPASIIDYSIDSDYLFSIGTTAVTATATNAVGSSSCTFNMSVNDAEAPNLSCPADITVDNEPGLCSAVVTYAAPEGVDHCSGSITALTSGLGSGAAFPVGTTTETYLASDGVGNTTSCSFTVTVNDAEAPSLSCPVDITVDTDPGRCLATVTYAMPVGIDNCSGSITEQITGLGVGAAFPVGTTTETYLARDGAGNSTSCSFTITVNDSEAPILSCPSSIAVDNEPGLCSAVVTYAAPAGVDHCSSSITALTSGLGSGAAFPVGTTIETYLASDGVGNTASCSFAIIVKDSEAPSLSCPADIVVDNDPGLCSAIVTYAMPVGIDNCSGSITEQITGLGVGGAFPVGTTTETYLARDGAGNTASCSFTITVNDAEDPIVRCLSNIIVDNDPGLCSAVVNYGKFGRRDNCSNTVVELTNGLGSGAAFPLGTTTETYVATDGAGNTTSCSFTVTVNDTEAPILSCPADITVDNESGLCSAVVNYSTPEGFDHCSSSLTSLTIGLGSGATFPVGTTIETYLASDGVGNTVSCSFAIRVKDSEAPSLSCPADITVDTDPGRCVATVTYSTPVGTDHCSGSITENTAELGGGNTFYVGTTTVTYMATDGAGNSASCSFTITVNDSEAPSLSCPADITVNTDSKRCWATVNYIIPVGTDNCSEPLTELIAGLGVGAAFPVGTTTETYMTTDGTGNAASCSFTITVNGTNFPFFSCPEDIVVDNDPNACSAIVDYTTPIAIDDCTEVNTVQIGGLGSGSAFPIGATTETYLGTNASGTSANCSFRIIVNDTEAPQIACPATTEASATSPEGAVVDYTMPEGTDNCTATSEQVAGLPGGATFPIGATVNTFTATDDAGNSQSCSFNVIVTGIAPDIVCPADITVNNDPGICGAVVEFTATETTGVPASAIDYSTEPGSLFSIGATAVTAIATNSAGSSSCTFNVSVNDTESPTLFCPADITVDNDPNQCSAVVDYAVPIGYDNCTGVYNMQTGGLGSGSAFPIGATTETYLATDASGNTAHCSFTITVNDTEAPVANCRNFTLQLDASGSGILLAEQIDAGSSDNCGLAGRTVNPNAFDCTDVGSQTVTLTITDYNGISNTCEASLTVEVNSAAEDISWTLAPPIKFWPPDYSYHTLAVSDMLLSLTDACGGDLNLDDVWIDKAVSDEAEDDPGTQDGNTLNDIVVNPNCRSVQLRKERMGGGNGRVYTITLAYRNAAGNIGYADFQTSVPLWAWGWNSEAVKDGAMYSEVCGGAGGAARISSNSLSQTTFSDEALQESAIQVEIYPNPFPSETNLRIQLPEAASVTISVYNLQGRLIRRLYEGELKAGEHQQQWNGADVGGAPLPSGVYLIQLRSHKEVRNTKVLLQRH